MYLHSNNLNIFLNSEHPIGLKQDYTENAPLVNTVGERERYRILKCETIKLINWKNT